MSLLLWLLVLLGIAVGRPAGAQVGLDTRPANSGCVAPARPLTGTAAIVSLQSMFPAGPQPTAMYRSPTDPTRWYVAIKGGLIQRFTWNPSQPAAATSTIVLDLTRRVVTGIEAGLTGMAFHPAFPTQPYVYVHYSGPNVGAATGPFTEYISRFTSPDGGVTLDPASERVLMTLPETTPFHHAGKIAFGPDGYLYVGFGDGGVMQPARSQDVGGWYGKILRIDVNGGTPYAIPPDNPFAAGGGAPEVWAWGFRNPYQLSFDRLTHELWVGDVGFNTWEEVDDVVAGGNYGWPILEGNHCVVDPCDATGLDPPVVEHLHSDLGGDALAIIGGYVYRGSAIPELAGRYVYGDWNGNVWALMDDGTGHQVPELLASAVGELTGFAEDAQGELYVLTPGIRRIVRVPPPTHGGPFPQTISASGCRNATDPTQPAAGVIPYGVNVELWSDGAAKSRWMGVPDGRTIDVDETGDWHFPIGSVLMKDFVFQGRLVETRLFVRHADGGWAGYSYEWNDALTDATLLSGEASRSVGGQTWHYPSSVQCLSCHTAIAGSTLGPTTAQLNRTWFYATTGRLANQLDTLQSIGMLSAPLPAPSSQLPVLPGPGTPGVPTGLQARGYLQANCAHCHAPGGPTEATMDLRYTTAEASMNVCGVPPSLGDLGIPGALLVAPGSPARSILSARMHALDGSRMPPLGTTIVDPAGTQVVDAWITSGACTGSLPATTSTTTSSSTTSSTTTSSTTRPSTTIAITTTSSTSTSTSTATTTTSTVRATTTTRVSSTTSSSTTSSTTTTSTVPPTTLGTPVVLSFRSIGGQDGAVLEGAPGSGLGRMTNSTPFGVQVGDHATGAQAKAILSFDTSALPDGATIVAATVRLQRIGLRGANPFNSLGALEVDVQTGAFSGNVALEPGDFQAPATAPAAGTLSNPTSNRAWATGSLGPAGLAAINRTGTTQLRLWFTVPTNGNGIGDRIVFGSGDQPSATLRPELRVTYVQ